MPSPIYYAYFFSSKFGRMELFTVSRLTNEDNRNQWNKKYRTKKTLRGCNIKRFALDVSALMAHLDLIFKWANLYNFIVYGRIIGFEFERHHLFVEYSNWIILNVLGSNL